MATPQYSPSAAVAVPERRRGFFGDIIAGALLGDFARDLRLPGAITQIVLAFIPLIGSICALRDLMANLRHHDRIGAVLNFFALAPVLGGFSKTLEVVRALAHVGHAYQITRHQRDRRAQQRITA